MVQLEQIIKKASTLIAQEDYELAKIILEDIEKNNSKNKKIKELLEYCWLMNKEWDHTNTFLSVIDENTLFENVTIDKPKYLQNLGEIHFKWKNYSKSAEILEKKIALFGDDINSMIFLVNDYLNLGKTTESVKIATKIYEQNPNIKTEKMLTEVLFEDYKKYVNKEVCKKIITHGTRVLKNIDNVENLNYILATAHDELNNYDEALRYFYADYALHKDRYYTLNRLATYENRKENNFASKKFSLKAIEFHKKKELNWMDKRDYASDYYNLANSCSLLKEINKAESYYKKGLEIYPNNRFLLLHLGVLYTNINRIDDADKILKKLKDENTPKEIVSTLSSAIFYRKGLYDESLTEILGNLKQENTKLDDFNLVTTFNAGLYMSKTMDALIKQKDVSKTIDIVEKKIKELNIYEHAGLVAILLTQKLGASVNDVQLKNKIMNIILLDPSLSDWQKKTHQNKGFFKKILNKSRNPVEYGDIKINGFKQTSYILKPNNPNIDLKKEKSRLKKEYIANYFYDTQIEWYFKDVMQKELSLALIPKPIVFLENDESAIFIQEKINTQNLESMISDKTVLIDELDKSIRSLALLHVLGISNMKTDNSGYYLSISDSNNNAYELRLDRINEWDNFLKRAITGYKKEERLGKNSEFKEFFSTFIQKLGDSSNKGPIHGDAYLCNTLQGGFWIDFEKMKAGNPIMDVADLLEHPTIEFNDKLKLLNVYIENTEYFASTINYKMREYDYETHFVDYLIYQGFCQIGAKLAQGKTDGAVEDWRQTLELMTGDLKDKAVKYIKSTKHEELKRAL